MLTVCQQFSFYAHCKGAVDIQADVAYVMSLVGIAAHADKLTTKLSGVNKRKISLAIALVGNPPVLLLDEPSTVMDTVSKRVF
jgi:ABC-type multidrug transport system ATPase subunit